jgi:predicted acylesterase/phospholipase RssA
MKKALVISGGGVKGAWALGWIDYNISKNPNFLNEFDLFIGTSIGALISVGLSIGKFKEMKELFLKLTNDDVYTKCPFKIKEKHGIGVYDIKINLFNVFYNLYIKNLATIGDTTKAIDLIKKIYTAEDHLNLIKSNKELYVTTTNINTGELLYVSPKNLDYETFINFVFSSTCAAPIMSMMEINGHQYVDGGVLENVPIQKAVENTNITDIVVLNLNSDIKVSTWINSPIKLVTKYFDVFLKRGNEDDILIGMLKATQLNKTIKIYTPSQYLTDFPFVFDNYDINEFFKIGISDAERTFYFGNNEKIITFDNGKVSISKRNKF